MLKEQAHKISCVMVTCGRVQHVIRAIRCYLHQTYPNLELVIVSQGSPEANEQIRRYVRSLQRRDVRFYDAPQRLSLGAMRNLSCEIAFGDIICQWDDDDLYHPTRVVAQYKTLISYSKHTASAFSKFLKYYHEQRELYWCDWSGEGKDSSRFLCGSVMFYKKLFHRYKSAFYPETGEQSDREEDLNVLCKLLDYGTVAAVGGGYQYLYAYHGNNTYSLQHHLLTLLTNSGKHVASVDELLVSRSLLTRVLGVLPLDPPIHVRSLTETAFTFEGESSIL